MAIQAFETSQKRVKTSGKPVETSPIQVETSRKRGGDE